jgi:polysaccharide pyruvyl transferase WcaK-like protein
VVGAFGTGNIGDDAILLGTINNLMRERGVTKENIIVFTRNPEETSSLYDLRSKRKNVMDVLKSKELVIAGGQLLQDENNMAIKYALLGIISKMLGKKVYYNSIGVSVITNSLGKFLTKNALNFADEVSVRDEDSRKRLENIGVKRNIEVRDDPAFYLEPKDPKSMLVEIKNREGLDFSNTDAIIGFTTRVVHEEETHLKMLEFLTTLLQHVVDNYQNMSILFIPFCDHTDSKTDKDIIYGKIIQSKLGFRRFYLLQEKYRPEEVMGIIGNMDLMISSRLHPIIFATKVGTPCMGINVYEKIISFCGKNSLPLLDLYDLTKSVKILDEYVVSKKILLKVDD